jgi:hypothetical protein
MHKVKNVFHKMTLYAMSLMLLGGFPMVARADEPVTYIYDAENQRWNTDSWTYDSSTGVYVPASTSGTAAPPESSSSAKDKPVVGIEGDSLHDDQSAIVVNENAQHDSDITNQSTIDNTSNSGSVSGAANVTSNLKAGDAGSGNAEANTTTVNSVHSSIDGETQGVAHFTTNIYGDVVGDIMIGPAIDNATIDRSINISSNANVRNDDTITNTINTTANSGDANVKGNNTAGSAKSGNANAVANVLNLINTIIAANKSFVGTINIHGNLNGDILVSSDFIPQLLASNADNKVNISVPISSTTNINDDQSIINNIKLQATTGNANVKDNTGAGNAKTGTANTNLTVLNLTGRTVDAKKSLLVFVNVLGKWVGMIVDAPGATAAAYGSGVTNDTLSVDSKDTISSKARITNNINLAARSGDANVNGNTSAGDALTGDATASANIANISTSKFKLSDWFGVLFINVFGTWIGSFGVDTTAGTLIPLSGMATASESASGSPNIRFGFRPYDQQMPNIDLAALEIITNGNDEEKQKILSFLANPDQAQLPGAGSSSSSQRPTKTGIFPSLAAAGGLIVAGATGLSLIQRHRRKNGETRGKLPAAGLVMPR